MKKQMKSLSINKMNVANLNVTEMQAVVAGGPKRSIKKEGDCRYSRNHYTQCTEGNNYSRSSVCVECPNS
ncbi:MAG: class I lanthipeptide [Bacteroidota bacterium]